MKINRSNNIWFRLRLELLPQNRIQRDHFCHFTQYLAPLLDRITHFLNQKYTFLQEKLRFLDLKHIFAMNIYASSFSN